MSTTSTDRRRADPIPSLASLASRASLVAAVALALAAGLSPAARAADDPPAGDAPANDVGAQMRALPWQQGPADGAVGSRAHIAIPDHSRLLPEDSGSRFLELSGNLPSPGNTILMSRNWWAVLSFSDDGYIKDDEKLDADKLLKELQEQDEAGNEERRRRHLAEIHTDGWIVPPHYDTDSKQLEWGVRLRSSDSAEPVVNYTMRVLGRHGYESVTLVTEPKTLDADVKDLRQVLKGFDFNAGERYSEFRAGDHVAEYGLGALVVGGAAAAALKGGWFKGLLAMLVAGWKLVAAGAVALFAAIGKFFNRATGRK